MVMCPDLLQTELFAKIVLGFSLFSRHVVSVETRPSKQCSMVSGCICGPILWNGNTSTFGAMQTDLPI